MVRAGPYELLEQIGRGGMGTVWRARHTELGVVRAVKLLERTTPERAARFQREVALLARVRHPNVVAIHEAGLADERPFFAMELLEGESLDRVLERGALPWRRGVEVLAAIARGVGALHAAGIVHRDLKPQNVVLDREGRPVVLDLGVALAPEQDARLTRPGGLVGTIAYLPPEALRGERTGARGDVFALGVILFELLRGAPALELRAEPQAALAQVALRGALRPGLADPALPARLDAACARATDPSPARRHADASALADELEALLREPGHPCAARRPWRAGLLGLGLLGAAGIALLVRGGQAPDGAASPPGGAPGAAGSATRPPGVGPPSPGSAAPTLDPDQVEAGERELRRALRQEEPPRRLAALGAWLLAYPGHPRADEARAARRLTRLQVPVRTYPLGLDCRATWDLGPGPARVWCATEARLWLVDAASGERLQGWTLADSSTALVACPGGGVWVSGVAREPGARGFVSRFPAGPGEALESRQVRGYPRCLLVVGEGLACAVEDEVELWVPGGGEPARGRAPSTVRCLAASPDGRWLAAGHGAGATAQVPYGETGVVLWRLPGLDERRAVTLPDKANCVVFAPDGRLIAGTATGRLVLIDPQRGELAGELVSEDPHREIFPSPIRAHDHGVQAAALGADPQLLFSAGGDGARRAGEVRAWDLRSGRERRPAVRLAEKAITVQPAPDGRWLLVGGEVGGVFLFADQPAVDPAGELLEPAPSARR